MTCGHEMKGCLAIENTSCCLCGESIYHIADAMFRRLKEARYLIENSGRVIRDTPLYLDTCEAWLKLKL